MLKDRPRCKLLLSEVHEFDIQSNPGIVIMISNDKIARLWFLNNK